MKNIKHLILYGIGNACDSLHYNIISDIPWLRFLITPAKLTSSLEVIQTDSISYQWALCRVHENKQQSTKITLIGSMMRFTWIRMAILSIGLTCISSIIMNDSQQYCRSRLSCRNNIIRIDWKKLWCGWLDKSHFIWIGRNFSFSWHKHINRLCHRRRNVKQSSSPLRQDD